MQARLPFFARHGLRLLAGGLLLGSLLACGYKGPLYLPPPEDPPAALTVPPGHDAPPGSSAN
ncbi:MAG: lipoprotein [Burkholderiaceae bacterium]